MTGGLINIATKGSQDIYLTGVPEISFLKSVYRRHTHYSSESIELKITDNFDFNNLSTTKLPVLGDLIHKITLKIDIPEIHFNRILDQIHVNNSNIAYVNALNEFKKIVAFMNVNINAYRSAIDVYNAENIIYSAEMIENINDVFSTYALDTYQLYENTYFGQNMPYTQPTNTVNNISLLSLVSSIADPSSYPKQDLKNNLDIAIQNCFKLQKYYEDELNKALINKLDANNTNYKFAWTDRLGHALIDYVDINIGSNTIDRHYGMWLNIWYELTGVKSNDVYDKLIGNVPELTTFDRNTKPAYSVYIPLQFWFNRFSGCALPVVALQYHEVSLTISIKSFKDCAYIEKHDDLIDQNLNDMFINNKYSIYGSLFVDYIFLDTIERRKFAQSGHEYLIEQVQVLEIPNIDNQLNNIDVSLDFVNPTKELIFVIQKDAYVQNIDNFTKPRWDNYMNSIHGGTSINGCKLSFSGQTRIETRDAKYYNYLVPYYFHKNTPSDGVNVYSFCFKPSEHQPSGNCNFSCLTKSILNISINPSMFIYYDYEKIDNQLKDTILPKNTNVKLYVWVLSHNVLRIFSGMGALALV